MNIKKILAKILIIIIILPLFLIPPDFVSATARMNGLSDEQETKPWWWDMPIPSEDEEWGDEDEDFDIASPSNLNASPSNLLASSSNLLATPFNATAINNLEVKITDLDDRNSSKPGIQIELQSYEKLSSPVSQPSDFNLNLQITNSTTQMGGIFIAIPLDYLPDAMVPRYEHYQNYEMTDPVYVFDQISRDNDGIISRSEIVTREGDNYETLLLHLKEEVSTGIHNISLRFELNTQYHSNIPPGGISWIVRPFYSNGIDKKDLEHIEIGTTAKIDQRAVITREAPSNNQFGGSTVSILCTLYNNPYYEAWLKSGSYSYVAVPLGYTVKGSEQTNLPKVDLTEIKYQGPIQKTIYGDEYLVYIKPHDNSENSWTNWNHNGVVGSTFNRVYLEITPPSDLNVGDEFEVHFGAELTRVNGAKAEIESSASYIKIEPLTWELFNGNRYHAHSSGLESSCGIENGDTGNKAQNSDWIHAGLYRSNSYEHGSIIKNKGPGTAENVRLELFRVSQGSARLNFNSVQVGMLQGDYEDAMAGTKSGEKCYFKLKFEIKNAKNTDERTVIYEKNGQNAFNSTFAVAPTDMPALNDNEYIDKVIVIPMGDDGTKEGEWLPGNIISLQYQPKAWDDQKWPDGGDIPDTPSAVTMQWRLYSNNKTTPELQSVNRNITYLHSNSVSVRALMKSEGSTNRSPGDIVEYNLDGYNDLTRINNVWNNPYLIIKVPNIMEMEDQNTNKDFINLVPDTPITTEKSVKVRKLPYQESGYDFYELQVNNIAVAAKRSAPVFTIPLKFKIIDATPQGTYRIPFVVVSQEDMSDFWQLGFSINNLSSQEEQGLELRRPKNYTAIFAGHDNLTISRKEGISSDVNVKVNSGQWQSEDLVAVLPDDQVTMRLILDNTGNVSFKNIKLYNILPYDNDERGSSGSVTFQGFGDSLNGLNADVWYTTETDRSILPNYDTVLNGFNPATDLPGATQTPGDLSAVTAIFIDFKEYELGPDKVLAPNLVFEIPRNETGCTAYNQFKYMVEPVGGGTIMEAICQIKGFSTNVLNLLFLSGAPEDVRVENMPVNQMQYTELSSDFLTIPDNIPTRLGYTFSHWTDAAGNRYSPNQEVRFEQIKNNNSIVLTAVWTAEPIKITYHPNDEAEPPRLQTKEYNYDHILAEGDLPVPLDERDGYRFVGWSLSNTATEPDFGVGTKIVRAMDVYAVWEELYTLTVSQQTAGAFADKTLRFDYEVTFEGGPGDGEVIYKRSDGGSGVFSLDSNGKGVFTFSLGEGESIIFQYFAAGDEVSYKILETEKDLYQPYVNAAIGSDGEVIADDSMKTNLAQGTIGVGGDHSAVSYINERTNVPITGIVVDNTSNHMMVWIAVLGLLSFSTFYLYFRRKRSNRLY